MHCESEAWTDDPHLAPASGSVAPLQEPPPGAFAQTGLLGYRSARDSGQITVGRVQCWHSLYRDETGLSEFTMPDEE